MQTIGIDIGSLNIKAVVLGSEGIIGSGAEVIGDDIDERASAAIKKALNQAGLDEDGLPVLATGAGSKLVANISQRKTLASCLARGIHFLNPAVRTLVDMGAESTTVIRINQKGKLADWVNQDKCASGTGLFLQQMAKLMGVSLEDLSCYAIQAKSKADISSTCAVFAESEVISHVHRNPPTPKEDIAAGIYHSVASRTISLMKRLGITQDVAITGGVALNGGLVTIMQRELGFDLIKPEYPQQVAALGAAIIAREKLHKDLT